eukprot:TRINITY_DN49920_c0_g1_i1.p1 TRINITY_DN49920_c0_g1~~TRINITY_DN49920_c0_g1_i1.p1  ORF type:complete len:580 (+),score=117.76 TRINITY_DN49920_c0_g1_i1:46-1740(+)
MYSSGFRMPEELLKGKKGEQKEEIEDEPAITAKNMEEQRLAILNALNLSQTETMMEANKIPVADNRDDLRKKLVFNLDKEVDRLKRHCETMMLRKKLADNEANQQKEVGRDFPISDEEANKLIYLDEGRMQVQKNRFSILSPDNMNYEDLEELKNQHAEKLRDMEEEYSRFRRSPPSHPLNDEDYDSMTYEELIKLRKEHEGRLQLLEEEFERNKEDLAKSSKFETKPRYHNGIHISKSPLDYPPPNYKSSTRSPKKASNYSPKKTSALREEQRPPLSPTHEQYLTKYKKYVDLKNKKEEFVGELEKGEKDDWDKYTKGIESPHKKGIEMKQAIDEDENRLNCKFSGYATDIAENQASMTVTRPVDDTAALMPLKQKDKDSFVALRDLYNSLDTEGGNSVDANALITAIMRDKSICSLFYIKGISDLNKVLPKIQMEKEGFLSWSEFVELIFIHKRSVKIKDIPEEKPIQRTTTLKKNASFQALREARKRRISPHPFTRPKSVKPSKLNRSIESFQRLTGDDYKRYYNSANKNDPGLNITVPKPFKFTERDQEKKNKKYYRTTT